MERATNSPHDAVFKHLLSHRATARDFLDIHLPAPLRALCNLNTLRLESGSFIDDELRASHSAAVLSWSRFSLALPDVLAGRLCRSGHRAADLW